MSTTTTSMVETQRFGLSGINFNEIVVRIRSLVPSSLLYSTVSTLRQKFVLASGNSILVKIFLLKEINSRTFFRIWKKMECLKAAVGGSFLLLEYVLLWLFTSIELSMYIWRKRSASGAESSKPFVFFPCRFFSCSAIQFSTAEESHFQFTSNENQK